MYQCIKKSNVKNIHHYYDECDRKKFGNLRGNSKDSNEKTIRLKDIQIKNIEKFVLVIFCW